MSAPTPDAANEIHARSLLLISYVFATCIGVGFEIITKEKTSQEQYYFVDTVIET